MISNAARLSAGNCSFSLAFLVQSTKPTFCLLRLTIGHIHRLPLFQILVMEFGVQPFWFFFSFSFFYLPAQLSLLPRSVLLYGVAFGGCTAVWVKTISCEIENNHVERDWDGSSFSSSPLLSADSWLLLIKSTTVWTVAHNTFLSKCGEYCFCHRPNMWWCITMGFYGHF